MDTALTDLLVLLREVGVFVLPLITAWSGKMLIQWYQAQPAQRREFLTGVLDSAIYATEQLSKTKFIQDKRRYAIKAAADQLDNYGLKVDWYALETQLEGRVWKLLNEAKYEAAKPVAPVPVELITTST